MPSVTAITLNDNDTVTVTFDGAATYASGVITFEGARIPHSANSTDLRSFATSGSPTAGDGTSSHTYDIEQNLEAGGAAFRAWAGETFASSIPAGFVSGQAADDTIVPTNNSTEDGSPMVRMALFDTRFYNADDLTDGKLTVYVEAHGFGGAGAGVSGVSVEADDGVNTSSATATFKDYTTPDGGTWRGWVAEVDMSSIADGTVTMTATASSNAGLGDGTQAVDILFDGGGTLSSETYYIDGTGGNNSNAGTTSGAPLLNIGGAINKARLAGLDYTTFRFITAGDYGSRDGDAGVAFTGPVKCQADVAGVVLTASVSNQIAIRANSIWCTSSNPSAHTIKMKLIGTTSGKTAQCSNSFYADNGCLITQDDPFANDTAVTPYPFRGDLKVHLYGVAMEDMLAGGADAGATREGGNIQGWHVRAARLTADPFDNFTTLVDCECLDLGYGENCATITYTGSAAGTVTKTGTFESGTRTLVLKEDGSEVLNITISDAAYDTWAEVKTAVDAVTDWSLTINGSPINTPPTMAPFTDEPVGSGGTVLYSRDAFHSDLYQIWHSEARSVYINGLRCTRADRLGEGAGNYGEQTFWFDHTGPLNLNKVVVLNVTDSQTIGSSNIPQVRSAVHGNIKNAFFGFITSPDARMQLNYNGGITSGSNFKPVNFTMAYTAFRNIESSNGTDDGSDCILFENHDHNASATNRVTGTGQTNGTIAAAYTAYDGITDNDNVDFKPSASSPLLSRASCTHLVDATGDQRGSSIGGEEATPAAPSPGDAPAGVTGAYAIAGTGAIFIIYDAGVTYTGGAPYPFTVTNGTGSTELTTGVTVINSNTFRVAFDGEVPAVGDTTWTVSLNNSTSKATTTSNGAPVADFTDLAVGISGGLTSTRMRDRSRTR